jgi:peptidoglycan/xylan/chitin deacetylase (PgdA/CDA1 family)
MFVRVRRKLLAPLYRLARNTIRPRPERCIVSFSFDDFPGNAATIAAGILEQHGGRGTYFVAGSLVATASHQYGPYCSVSDLAALASRSHEIGCHTYGHAPISKLSPRALIEDLDRNAGYIAEKLGGYVMRSFAYPFGDMSPMRKLQVQTRFASCRGNSPGLNVDEIDLGALRAEQIYQREFDRDHVANLIREAGNRSGWLIFYTHDVGAQPSPYGCKPDVFEWVVKQAVASGARILPIGEATALLTGRPAAE